MALTLTPLLSPFAGQQLGQSGESTFRGGIGRDPDAALEGEQRGDVDDLTPALVDHVAVGGLRQEEGSLQVDVDHRVPVFLGEVERIGAADDAEALLTRMSRPPKVWMVSVTIPLTGSMLARSALTT